MTRAARRRALAPHDGPVLAILYLRLSDARLERGTFAEREAALRQRAAQLGWKVLRVVIENDEMAGPDGERRNIASAFKRRRVERPDGSVEYRVWRPGFRSILEDLTAGRAHALLAEDLDRSLRDPRDCEDLIDVVEMYGCSADSLSGSLRFTRGGTDAEIMMARGMVNHANLASRDTARRVSGGRARGAVAGRFGGGARPYGWGLPLVDEAGRPVLDQRTGKQALDYNAVVPEEAAAVRLAADLVLSDVPLRGVAQALNERGVKPARAAQWRPQVVRDMLLKPRNAGWSTLHGEVVGRGAWPPLLPDEVWQALVAKLTAPGRRTTPGPAPKWLGSGIYLCGKCGGPLYVDRRTRPSEVNARKGARLGKSHSPAYWCPRGHMRRKQPTVDALVVAVVLERLARPDAAELLAAPAARVDVGELRARAAQKQRARSDLAALHSEGLIALPDLRKQLAAIKEDLAAIDAALAESAADPLLHHLVGAADVEAAWAELVLDAKRGVLRRLVKVTILPTARGTGGNTPFDVEAIRIEDAD